MAYRLGVDIGGTFTDLVIQSETGRIHTLKVPSTPDDPSQAVLNAIGLAAAEGIGVTLSDVSQFIHSTTIASNTILQANGARTGLLVTEGFRDLLDIRRHKRYALFDAAYRKLPPLIERRLTFGIPERIDAQGEVVEPLDEEAVRAALRTLAGEGVEAIAICFLFSFRNNKHEVRAAEIAREMLPDCFISYSSAIYPQYREYERASTAAVNSYLGPNVSRYVDRLSREARRMGVQAPLQLMQSNGGIIAAAQASTFPCRIVESGPAAGVIASNYFGSLVGRRNIIAFDMGGTTAKAGLIENGEVRISPGQEVGTGMNMSRLLTGGGYFIGAATVDLAEVGAGGGSLVRLDANNVLKVGPESAGAVPGPICYGKGGDRVTVTDANVLLNRIPADHFLGGRMQLDVKRTRAIAQEQLAGPLGVSVEEVCAAIVEVANANMLKMLRIVSVEQGYDPQDFCLIPSGGSGPVHAVELAQELGITEVIVPPAPGLLSSQGLLSADVRYDFRRTFVAFAADADLAVLNTLVGELRAEGARALSEYALPASQTEVLVSADMRYLGQAYEINVPLSAGELGEGERTALIERFHKAHERIYGRRHAEGRVQFVNIILTMFGRVRALQHPELPAAEGQPKAVVRARTWFNGQPSDDCPCYDRDTIRAGHQWQGPAVVAGADSTIVIPPGWSARCDRFGNILVTRAQG
ncbi:MAG: hydantoinase/oxoprolinase family protein [Rhizobiales bacterium]|jgi:N-methylhydantoinase A|nr:hydantoinase/oxoprolinase family protein [Hyphomicrobiales bacterium]